MGLGKDKISWLMVRTLPYEEEEERRGPVEEV
jgi:hypothetical protein